MKPQHFAALTGTLLFIALVLLFTGNPQTQIAAAVGDQSAVRTITVIGEGEYRPRPDLVQITVGVTTTGASAAEAEASHLALVKKITAAMTDAGADDPADTPQVTLTAGAAQDFPGMAPSAVFHAQSQVRVNVRSVPKHQAVIDASYAAGATSLDSVTFTMEQPERSRQLAVSQAVDNARARGKALAKAAGESMGDLRSMEIIEDLGPDRAGPVVFRVKVRAVFGI